MCNQAVLTTRKPPRGDNAGCRPSHGSWKMSHQSSFRRKARTDRASRTRSHKTSRCEAHESNLERAVYPCHDGKTKVLSGWSSSVSSEKTSSKSVLSGKFSNWSVTCGNASALSFCKMLVNLPEMGHKSEFSLHVLKFVSRDLR